MDCTAVAIEVGVVLDEFQALVHPMLVFVRESVGREPVPDVNSDAFSPDVWAMEDVDDERHSIRRHAADTTPVLFAVRNALVVLVDGLDVGVDR
jgi:hypothetical protein